MSAEQTLTVDGQQYRIDDLSDDAKAKIAAVRNCDLRIQTLQQDLAMAQTARGVYVKALMAALPDPVTPGEGADAGDADREVAGA